MTDHAPPTINCARNDDAIGDGIENSNRVDTEDDDYTAEALRALAELDTHGRDHIGFMLRFGEALVKAKRRLKHGHFKEWCGNILKRSPSWCSSYRRLFECRDDLEASLAWAKQTGHRWADCRSVEKLLKLVTEWKKATREDSAAAPKARRKARDIIAELTQRLSDAEADFVSLRDPLPGEIEAKVASLAAAINAGDFLAKEQLVEIARRFHWRLCDLLKMETCSALQVSNGSKTTETQQAHGKTEVA